MSAAELSSDWRHRLPSPVDYYGPRIAKLGKPNGSGWAIGCCPFHEDRTPSLSVCLNDSRGAWRCHAGCGAGDMIEFHQRLTGMSFIDAVHDLTGGDLQATRRIAAVPTRTTARAEPLDWSTRAEGIWRRTQAIRGTLGEVYLHHRGCALPPRDSHLRYLPGDDRYPPSLVAAITDSRTAKPISLHFTRLRADGLGKAGTERDKLLLAGHRKRGGCIRLWPDECVTYGLAIAEGIETALSAAHAYTPIWATIDCSGMAAFPALPGIEALIIFADGDDTGIDAAAQCAERWTSAGKDVLVTLPSKINTDMNDEVRA